MKGVLLYDKTVRRSMYLHRWAQMGAWPLVISTGAEGEAERSNRHRKKTSDPNLPLRLHGEGLRLT